MQLLLPLFDFYPSMASVRTKSHTIKTTKSTKKTMAAPIPSGQPTNNKGRVCSTMAVLLLVLLSVVRGRRRASSSSWWWWLYIVWGVWECNCPVCLLACLLACLPCSCANQRMFCLFLLLPSRSRSRRRREFFGESCAYTNVQTQTPTATDQNLFQNTVAKNDSTPSHQKILCGWPT